MIIRLVAIGLAVVGAGSCSSARAQPAEPTETPECSGVVWQRAAGIEFCTTTCTSDFECASGERCRVLDEEANAPVFADDVQSELAAAFEAEELASAEPIYDDEPVCEGDCAPYTGDLRIKPSVPLALCDPFHDVLGAIPSDADLAAAEVSFE